MSDRHRDREEEMEEDDEWLFDSIVGYLTSPIWKAPIEHFLNSITFCVKVPVLSEKIY